MFSKCILIILPPLLHQEKILTNFFRFCVNAPHTRTKKSRDVMSHTSHWNRPFAVSSSPF